MELVLPAPSSCIRLVIHVDSPVTVNNKFVSVDAGLQLYITDPAAIGTGHHAFAGAPIVKTAG
jgi:hypothetical protein